MQFKILITIALCVFTAVAVNGREGRVKRLISGIESDHSESPYMVSLQGEAVKSTFFGIPTSYSHAYCGGTIISERWILTAAHCFRSISDPDDWHARIASPNLERTSAELFLHMIGKLVGNVNLQQMEYHAEEIIQHPDFNAKGDLENDIALVKLKETIPFGETSRVGKVQRANSTDTFIAGSCTAYGWGCDEIGTGTADVILKANLPILTNEACSRYWDISPTQICAGGRSANMQSACHGDSGGPLVCKTAADDLKQVGVISFISYTQPTLFPVVLSRISAFESWINSHIN
ncbi:chymotrypsinogen A-like [Watersipora subatra]|uniref:chymotrypsinogen A-like n=1 Tax=Watersipora subatra TaxID=2589382 RepID=UPI00355AF808